MKNLYFLLFLSIISVVGVSCNGDEEPEQNRNQPGALVATIAGDAIDNETIDFKYQPRAVVGKCDDITCMFIDGMNSAEANKEFSLSINNLTSAGTYVIGGTSNNYGLYSTSPVGGGEVTFYGSSTDEGSLTVTSYQGNKIKGNFNFPAVKSNDANTVVVISGTFDLSVSE